MKIGIVHRFNCWRSVALLLLIVAMPDVTSGQTWPSELWHDGRIVLVGGDTLRGQIKYDLQQDLIQYNKGERTEAFSARKVLFFEIFDNSVRKYRQFFALPYSTGTGYQTPIFFELLEEGELTLLSREAIEYRTYNSPYYIGSYSRQVLVNKYFFLNSKGTITEFVGNKSDLLQIMGKKSKDVERFMKANKLRYEEKYDFARIIGYYNSL
jgi:hypothetical protein